MVSFRGKKKALAMPRSVSFRVLIQVSDEHPRSFHIPPPRAIQPLGDIGRDSDVNICILNRVFLVFVAIKI